MQPREAISLEVTTHCNNGQCNYCFALADLPRKEHMSFETAQEIAAEGREANYAHLHITGGEPALWPPLLPFLEYVFAIGYTHVILNTNAMPPASRMYNAFVPYKDKMRFTVTLNGPKDVHEITRGKGSFEKASQGLEEALRFGLSVEIFTVLTSPLLPELPRFVVDVFERFPGISGITFIQLHRVSSDVHDLKGLILNPDQFIQAVRIISLLRLSGCPLHFLENPLASLVSQRSGFPPFLSPPLLRSGRLVVLANKTITGAHSSRHSFGQYEPGLILDILKSDDYIQSVSGPSEVCRGCPHMSLCNTYGLIRPYVSRDFETEPFCIRVIDSMAN